MQALRPQDPQARQLAASKTLAQLRTLLETEVAWTLKVRMGFTDNDGD
jgi:predicted lipoprotein